MAIGSDDLEQMPVIRKLADFDQQFGQPARAAGVQQPAGDAGGVRGAHRGAGLLCSDAAGAQRELREDDSAEPAVHQELPDLPEGPARPGQCAAGGGGEHRRRHLRPGVSGYAEAGQRRAGGDAGCGPGVGEVAVDAGGALDRGDGRGLSRRAGDAAVVRRLGQECRAAEAERGARRHPGQPRGQRHEVVHDLRAAFGQGPGHRQAHRLSRALAGAGGQDPRQVRAGQGGGRDRRQGAAQDQGARDRLRQADRRADRRPGQGDAVLRHRGADRHRASSTPTPAACAARRW